MNNKVFEALRIFIKDTLKYIEQNCYNKFSDQYRPYTLFFESGEYQQTFRRQIIEPEDILKNHSENIFDLSGTKEIIDIFLSENIFHCRISLDKLEDSSFYRPLYLHYTTNLLIFVVDYIERNSTLNFDEREFKKLYLKYEKGWMTDTHKLRAIVPLVNFDSDLDKIELYNDVIIERFDQEEKIELWNSHNLNTFFSIDDYAGSKFKIKCFYELGFEEGHKAHNKIIEDIEKHITAMRLVHKGCFGVVGFVESLKMPRSAHYAPTLIELMDYYKLPALLDRNVIKPDKYYFNSKNIEKLNKIYTNLKSENKLELGIIKFNQAYSRKRVEDAIIDLTIALESSLLFGTRDELKYRLAIRGATLLKGVRNSEDAYNVLRSLYDVRSKIVHDGQTVYLLTKDGKVEKKNKKEFISSNFQIVREILTEYLNCLNSGKGMQKINENLDKQIIELINNVD